MRTEDLILVSVDDHVVEPPSFEGHLPEKWMEFAPSRCANWLERIDYVDQQRRFWTHQDFGDTLPSEVARQHLTCASSETAPAENLCFIRDRAGPEDRHAIGVDNITWECDYPHSDSS